MRHLLACLAILAAFNVTAQVDGFQLPYNPDSEPDGYIGVGDVLEVLSIFGSQWNASDIYLSNDNSSMTMYVGDMQYYQCLAACDNLDGNWRMAAFQDYAPILDSIVASLSTSTTFWYNDLNDEYGSLTGQKYFTFNLGSGGYIENTSGTMNNNSRRCYCSTHERPKVEYSTCQGGGSEFDLCCQTKVQAGWYPLGGISLDQIGSMYQKQAFWRWAE